MHLFIARELSAKSWKSNRDELRFKICIQASPSAPPQWKLYDVIRQDPGWLKFNSDDPRKKKAPYSQASRILTAMHTCLAMLPWYYLDNLVMNSLVKVILYHSIPLDKQFLRTMLQSKVDLLNSIDRFPFLSRAYEIRFETPHSFLRFATYT